MKFKINDQIIYDGLGGIITGFYKETCNYKNVFEAEIKLADSVKYLLFDKDGYVKPFTENSNQPKVKTDRLLCSPSFIA